MSTQIKGGLNIAMKVPSHQYEAVIAFYRREGAGQGVCSRP